MHRKTKFYEGISHISTEATEGEFADYIARNTSLTDCSKFKAHKFIEKDICDSKSLKFVSLKMETNDKVYNISSDPNVWPEAAMAHEY